MNKEILKIEESLKEMEIYSYEDYLAAVSNWEAFDVRVFYGGQQKINELRNIVAEYYKGYSSFPYNGQYISIDAKTSEEKLIENYLCMFPKRSLIETGTLMTFSDTTPFEGEEYDMPPNDFFHYYYKFKELLHKDVAYLYPVDTSEEESHGMESVEETGIIHRLKNVVGVRREGNIYEIINHKNECFAAFPWLYNARVGDFLDICDKYPSEFEMLSKTMEKLSLSMNGNGDFRVEALKEMEAALENLQIAFEKKKVELKRKGIITAVGLVLTILPQAIPLFTDNTLPEIVSKSQKVLGSTTLKDSKKMLEDYFSIKTEGKADPYWVLWKWKQETESINVGRPKA